LNLSTDKNIPIFGTIEEALNVPCDLLMDYTAPDIAKHHVVTAINKGVNVVIGTSGLLDKDYAEIKLIADKNQKSVLAVGNFAISVVLLNRFAEIAAKYMPHWEIIDYANQSKIDTPSGSAMELANRLSRIGESIKIVPVENMKQEAARNRI
jgi:4-hydroxy-tetrahydrodipicolinate reductase